MDDTGKGADMAKNTCSVDGCARVQLARGWCRLHYSQQWRIGAVPPRPTNEEQFWAKVDKNGPVSADRPELGPCWIRPFWLMRNGYALWQVGRRGKTMAHRYAYELAHGPIPAGLHIDHLCRNRICVRPSHLEAVTPAENNRRAAAVRVRRTHCPRGHEYAGYNLIVTARNEYVCRVCRNVARRRRRAEAACLTNSTSFTPRPVSLPS